MTDYDFDIAQVGDRISYTEDTNRNLRATGKLIHLVDRKDNFQVGVARGGARFDWYWVIPKGKQAFDYTVELLEWADDE